MTRAEAIAVREVKLAARLKPCPVKAALGTQYF